MAANEAVEAEVDLQDNETPEETDGERGRSTIAFPYGDLNDAVEVAKGVNGVGGSSCELEQLAAQLKQKATGGGFRQRLLTAKVFGFVTYSLGKITLTALGTSVCDQKQEKAAKAQGFLFVPLYKAVYEKFKSGSLPPAIGLEAEMVALGVAKKQTGKARQVFLRSANQAGFFWSGQDRLVMPKGNGEIAALPDGHGLQDERKKRKHDGGDDDDGGVRHPLIEGLIKTLKNLPDPWLIEAQRKWLQTAANIFDMIYPTEDGRSIRVEIQKDSAN